MSKCDGRTDRRTKLQDGRQKITMICELTMFMVYEIKDIKYKYLKHV